LAELQEFLAEIILNENTPVSPITDDDIRDSKIIHKMDGGGFITELERKRQQEFSDKFERLFLFAEGSEREELLNEAKIQDELNKAGRCNYSRPS
jgi:hypothetical protein